MMEQTNSLSDRNDTPSKSAGGGRSGVKLFATGGTFDKEYNELTGTLGFAETHLSQMLKEGRNRVQVDVRTLMLIDSLDQTDADRQLILEQCRQTVEEQIVITHGTDNMTTAAKVLGEANLAKTIVLTGAMRPFTFGSSDGLFNLGAAFAFAQTLPHGVYVAMNGRYFTWDNVRKNRDKGEFEEVQ